jgi:hypothetical protein
MEATTTTATSPATTETTTATETKAAATPEQKVEQTQQAQLKKFKLKVDGEEFEEEIDLANEGELTKRLQLAKAAEKRIGQAKSEKAKAMEILKAFEDGTLLKKHPKARELAEQLLVEQLQNEMLSPEQRELMELKKYKEDREKSELERQKALEMAEAQQKESAIAQQFQKTIIDALDKSGLPKTPDMAKRMAYIMKKNLDLGLSLTPEDLAAEVKSELNGLLKALIGGAEGEQLISLFGDDVAKKIRAYDVKKLKDGMKNNASTKKEDAVKQPKREDGKPLTIEEWKEQIRARARS